MTLTTFGENYFIKDISLARELHNTIKEKTKIEINFLFEDGISIKIPDYLDSIDKKDSFRIYDPKDLRTVLEIYEGFGNLEFTLFGILIGTLEIQENYDL